MTKPGDSISYTEELVSLVNAIGFVGTWFPNEKEETAMLNALLARFAETEGRLQCTSAVAYLQVPSGMRQRIRLWVLIDMAHHLAPVAVKDPPKNYVVTPKDFRPVSPDAWRLMRTMVRQGVPVIVERSTLDQVDTSALNLKVIGPTGIRSIERQTLRLWGSLVVWLQEYHTSPKGVPSAVESWGDFRGDTSQVSVLNEFVDEGAPRAQGPGPRAEPSDLPPKARSAPPRRA